MPYASDDSGVELLCPDLTTGGVFDGTTLPTSTAVATLQTDASLYIDMRLSAAGFTTPITNATAITWLAPIEELVTAAMAYLVRFHGRATTTALEEEGDTRPGHLFREAEKRLKFLLEDEGAALMTLGLTKTSEVGEITLTSRLQDDKDDLYDDPDVVQPRFKTGQFRRT